MVGYEKVWRKERWVSSLISLNGVKGYRQEQRDHVMVEETGWRDSVIKDEVGWSNNEQQLDKKQIFMCSSHINNLAWSNWK